MRATELEVVVRQDRRRPIPSWVVPVSVLSGAAVGLVLALLGAGLTVAATVSVALALGLVVALVAQR